MSFKSIGNFELKFVEGCKFEINCDNQGQALVILDLLSKTKYVSNVTENLESSGMYSHKINGETTKQEDLLKLLKEWHETLAEMETSKYQE